MEKNITEFQQHKGMKKQNKWKYLLHFQDKEFNEVISKEILEMVDTGRETIEF